MTGGPSSSLEYGLLNGLPGGFRLNRVAQDTDAGYLDLHQVSRLQGHGDPGAARVDKVSRPQGHLLADVADDLGEGEQHLLRVAVLYLSPFSRTIISSF